MPEHDVERAQVEADALHRRVRWLVAARASFDFDAMALDLAIFQHDHLPAYARLCAARGVDPRVDLPAVLPAVPTDAFRILRVATFPASLDTAVFRTSGTTQGQRGAHPMRTLETYRDVALAWARETLFARFVAPPLIVAIAPDERTAPDSSLSRMLRWFVDEIGAPGSSFVSPNALDDACDRLRAASKGERPVVVLATAFAYVHLIDDLDGRGETLTLPAGSRAMQTGGFKGRSREISASDLRASIARILSIPTREIVGEYGMTELTSQLYAIPPVGPLDAARDEKWIYRAPPWMRVRACDPITLSPLPTGAIGIARIEDLANVESAWAIQTADRIVVQDDGGIELLGRLPGATPRGCSLAIEELRGVE